MAKIGTCFSAAIIWRCSGLREIENQLLIIGPSIQLLVSILLLFTNRSSATRTHLLLSAEGISYFAFCLLDLLSKLLAAEQQSFAVFNVIDNILAAASFLPIFFYMLFIFLHFRSEIIRSLPRRLQNLIKILFLLFIPVMVILSELSSFLGVRRTLFSLFPGDPQIVGIGFDNRTNGQGLWSLFTSFALVIFALYQFGAFCLAFYRLLQVGISQRQIEQSNSEQTHRFNGIGWIALGLKIGAVEAILGFFGPSFGLQMTRRLLRAASRAVLYIGIYKGGDVVEDFAELQEEAAPQFRRSRLLKSIGNPVQSTFTHMSPTAGTFHSTLQHSPTSLAVPSTAPNMRQFTELRGSVMPNDRVTVFYNTGAPMLQMRFSALNMPSPGVMADDTHDVPSSIHTISSEINEAGIRDESDIGHESGKNAPGHQPSHSVADSTNTMAAVRELASHFPDLPTNRGVDMDSHDVPDDASLRSTQTKASSQLMSIHRSTWYPSAVIPSPVVEEGSIIHGYEPQDVHPYEGPSGSRAPLDGPPTRGRFNSDLSASSPLSRFTRQSTIESTTSPDIDPENEAFDASPKFNPAYVMLDLDDNNDSESHVIRPSQSSRTLIQYATPVRRPTFSKSTPVRESVHLQIQPPPSRMYQVEAFQSDGSSTNGDSFILRDEEAMEMEHANR